MSHLPLTYNILSLVMQCIDPKAVICTLHRQVQCCTGAILIVLHFPLGRKYYVPSASKEVGRGYEVIKNHDIIA